jgi:hypothetical protein
MVMAPFLLPITNRDAVAATASASARRSAGSQIL